jgi:hypothetical protein
MDLPYTCTDSDVLEKISLWITIGQPIGVPCCLAGSKLTNSHVVHDGKPGTRLDKVSAYGVLGGIFHHCTPREGTKRTTINCRNAFWLSHAGLTQDIFHSS